jgi:hypothetical protein
MTRAPGILRRTYDYVALVALLQVISLLGIGVYLASSGAVDRDKVAAIAEILRGQPAATATLVSSPVEPAESERMHAPEPGRGQVVSDVQQEREALRLEAERIRTELEQRLTLNNTILLRVTTQREAFQKEQKAAQEQTAASEARRNDEGFQKQIAIFESLAPKVAVEHLLSGSDPDEAARILMEMDNRKAKKIVEAAKSSDQKARMHMILQRLRDVAPFRSAELESE